MKTPRRYSQARHREWREHIHERADEGGCWENTPEARSALPGATYLADSTIYKSLSDMEKLGMLTRIGKGKYTTDIPRETANV